jgi:hypothetical protein
LQVRVFLAEQAAQTLLNVRFVLVFFILLDFFNLLLSCAILEKHFLKIFILLSKHKALEVEGSILMLIGFLYPKFFSSLSPAVKHAFLARSESLDDYRLQSENFVGLFVCIHFEFSKSSAHTCGAVKPDYLNQPLAGLIFPGLYCEVFDLAEPSDNVERLMLL